MQRQAHLTLDGRNIPIKRAFKTSLLKQYRMQGLREATDVIQRGLRDFADFLQIVVKWIRFRNLLACAPKQNTDCREYLAKFIVELTRNMAQGEFLSMDQFLRQFAALCGHKSQSSNGFSVREDKI